jgi:uncharacterized repeat protein (TIGR01451 family)
MAIIAVLGLSPRTARAVPGDLLGTVTLPGNGGCNVTLTFTGVYVLTVQSGGCAGTTIGVYSPPPGGNGAATLVATKAVVDGIGNPVTISGLAWDPSRGKVWAAHNGDNAVYLVDIGNPAVSGNATATFQFSPNVSGFTLTDGLEWDPEEDTLWYSPDVSCDVFEFGLGTTHPLGALVSTVSPKNAGGEVDCRVSGIEVGAGNTLFIARNGEAEIRRVDKTTGAFISQFATTSGRVEDLSCDPVTYAPKEAILAKDAFSQLYEAFEVEPGTCPLDTVEVDLSVEKTDSPDPVTSGSAVTYTITVTNHGSDDATGVMLTDTLPAGVTFNSATPSQGSCMEAGGLVTCDLGSLANGASATVTITVTPFAVGTIVNTVSVTGNEDDPDPSNNTDTEETTVVPLAISIDIKPGSFPNSIKLTGNGVIPVAILTTPSFDAATVDPGSVCFGDAEDPSQRDCTEAHGTGHLVDVDGDGDLDLVLHFETAQTGIDSGDTQACLGGVTFGGVVIESCDSINPLP